tara:strand:- start:909 stop:1163 length:255 start_codon:yes stop_codon:yes gene_type:complete
MKVKATVIIQITQEWEIDIPKEEIEIFTSTSLSDEEIDGKLPTMDTAIDTIELSVQSITPNNGNNVKFISQKFEDIETMFNLQK